MLFSFILCSLDNQNFVDTKTINNDPQMMTEKTPIDFDVNIYLADLDFVWMPNWHWIYLASYDAAFIRMLSHDWEVEDEILHFY